MASQATIPQGIHALDFTRQKALVERLFDRVRPGTWESFPLQTRVRQLWPDARLSFRSLRIQQPAARRSRSASSRSASWAVPAFQKTAPSGSAWRAAVQIGLRDPAGAQQSGVSHGHSAKSRWWQYVCLRSSPAFNWWLPFESWTRSKTNSRLKWLCGGCAPAGIHSRLRQGRLCSDRADVLHNISFAPNRGEVVGLLGPTALASTTPGIKQAIVTARSFDSPLVVMIRHRW